MITHPSQGSVPVASPQTISAIASIVIPLATPTHNRKPFPFFDLPSELRSKIFTLLLITETTIDLHPQNYRTAHQRLNIFLASQRMHSEASHIFYSRHTFRLFPTHGRYVGNRIAPLVARLPRRYRACLTSLELRLGPGWGGPPQSWRVHEKLGLGEMENLRVLKVFVEVDPSQDIFNGFRTGKNFYTEFSRKLLEDVTKGLPGLHKIEFDAWPSVMMKDGTLMKTLVSQAKALGVNVCLLRDLETPAKTTGGFCTSVRRESILVS